MLWKWIHIGREREASLEEILSLHCTHPPLLNSLIDENEKKKSSFRSPSSPPFADRYLRHIKTFEIFSSLSLQHSLGKALIYPMKWLCVINLEAFSHYSSNIRLARSARSFHSNSTQFMVESLSLLNPIELFWARCVFSHFNRNK